MHEHDKDDELVSKKEFWHDLEHRLMFFAIIALYVLNFVQVCCLFWLLEQLGL